MSLPALMLLIAYQSPGAALVPIDSCPSNAGMEATLRLESAQHPGAAVQDVYKLLYQMTLGGEHAALDSAEATAWLASEWQALKPLPAGAKPEHLVDTLGEGGPFARVNLRPYVARGGRQAPLLAAFLRTGRMHESAAILHCAEAAAVIAARKHMIRWSADNLQAYFAGQTRGGDTAVHHSAAYEARYDPSYRVVALSEIPALLRSLVH